MPPGPQFVAAGDFNNDGIADAVVTDTIADKITVLFGSSDGSFKSVVGDRQVGNLLRGVVTADFNGDHNQDIAVVDVNLSRVFMRATATARLTQPETFSPTARGRTALPSATSTTRTARTSSLPTAVPTV